MRPGKHDRGHCHRLFRGPGSRRVSQELRAQMFRKVMGFYNGELGRFSTASLITRSTNGITQVQMLVAMGLPIITKTPIMMV